MHVKLGKQVVVVSELGPVQSKLTFSMKAAPGARGVHSPESRPIPRPLLRGVIIFTDRVACAEDGLDIPGLVSDWRPIDEQEYDNPTVAFD